MFKWLSNIGPGTMIAAAFIGPGTVTVCTLAGVNNGFDLLWAMLFSIIATVVLQEMSARIGLVTNKGIAEIIRSEIKNKAVKYFAIFLVLSAIVIGNAAYEAGNLSGAVMGIDVFSSAGSSASIVKSLVVGILAFVILYLGNYKVIERLLVGVVILMSISFMAAAIATGPSLMAILKGLFVPSLPTVDSVFTIMTIVGTTVVPYNLFLHASLVKERWQGTAHLGAVRRDLYISIFFGGLISIMIIIAAASLQGEQVVVTNALDMAVSLEGLLGSWAKYLIGLGLFAAGLTSAITAPLAAAYVCTGLLGYDDDLKSTPFRIVWIVILLIGVAFSLSGYTPIQIIRYAQFTNGLLLPIIAGFLLWIVNSRSFFTSHRNTSWQNILGLFILMVTIALGIKSIYLVIETIIGQ